MAYQYRLSFVMVAIGSYVYNWVITKMGGTDNVQAIMKVSWYLQGYRVLLFSIGYTIVLAFNGHIRSSHPIVSAFAGVIYFVGTIALLLYPIWVSLELMARQVNAYEDESIHCLHLNVHNLRL